MRSWMIAFMAGAVAVAGLPRLPAPPCKWVLLAVAVSAALGGSRGLRLASGFACGVALALLHGERLLDSRLSPGCEGRKLAVVGRVVSLPERALMPDGTPRHRFELAVQRLRPDECRGPRRIDVSLYGDHTVAPGQQWRLSVKARRPWGLANPASYNAQAWFAERGVDAVGSVSANGPAEHLPAAPGWSTRHHRLRSAISSEVATLPVDSGARGVLAAVTVADRGAVGDEVRELFRRLGLSHLLVISGLHIGLAAAVGYLAGALCQRLAWPVGRLALPLAPAAALLVAAAYSALAGFSLPTQRALFMLAAFTLAASTGRRSGSFTTLLAAAVAVLGMNPLAVIGSSFWLSFGAVAALLWLARWQMTGGRLTRALGTHGYMTLVMLPLGGWFFGGGSLVAAGANLLMIPLLGFWVVPLALSGVVFSMIGSRFAAVAWCWAAWPLEQVLPFLENSSGALGDWAYRPVETAALPVALGLAGCLLWVLPLSRWRRVAAGLLLLPLLVPGAPPVGARRESAVVTVLDVGQGTSVVIRSGERTLLYDTGGGVPGGRSLAQAVVVPYLRSRNVRALDTLVVSHGDLDHSAGTDLVLANYPVGRLRLGGDLPVGERGRRCAAGESWQWPGGLRFRFLSPGPGANLGSNNGSCVLQVEIGPRRLLLPGDIEARQERDLVRYWRGELASDWLLAPHHGSGTSSSHALLKHVSPDAAIVSSGYRNRFGHPHPMVVQRLSGYGAEVLNTAQSGALEFHFQSNGRMTVQRQRQRQKRYWM